MALKLQCDECTTIFYVLKTSFDCPKCGSKVNPRRRFTKNQASAEEVDEELLE